MRFALADQIPGKARRSRLWATGLSLALLGIVLVVVLLRDGREVVPPDDGTQRPDRADRSLIAATALTALEKALADHDVPAAESLGVGHVVTNAGALDVTDFGLRYVDEDEGAFASGGARWVAAVQTTWRIRGFDEAAASTEVSFTFQQEGDAARILAIGGHGRRSPLWLSGPVEVRTRPGALVIATDAATADRYVRYAGAAVPAVRRVLANWTGRLVVEVPGSTEALHAALDAEPGEYSQIAAVTTTVDGSLAPQAPVHVFVNPGVFDQLRQQGAQVVMTHEATHVATNAATARMPMWLLEGFADYVALRDVDLPLSVTAGQIAAQVRREGVPTGLPGPEDFGTRTPHLGAAYEAAWLACVTLADAGGEANLVRYYQAVSGGANHAATVQRVFGFSHEAFVEMWRGRLRDLAS